MREAGPVRAQSAAGLLDTRGYGVPPVGDWPGIMPLGGAIYRTRAARLGTGIIMHFRATVCGCIPSSGPRLLSPDRGGTLTSPTGLSGVAAFTGPSKGRRFARADFHHPGRRRQDRPTVRVRIRAESDVPSTPVNSSGPAPMPANTAPDRPTRPCRRQMRTSVVG